MALSSPRYDFIYLASQSPRRRELLGQIGVRFEMLLADDDEDVEALEAVIEGESAEAYVSRVARMKAAAALSRRVRRGLPPAPILSADTTVAIDHRILGKPADAGEARDMLLALSGRRHQVLTAVAVVDGDAVCTPADVSPGAPARLAASPTDAMRSATTDATTGTPTRATLDTRFALSTSNVLFTALDAVRIDRYIASGEPFGKAGGYGIQGRAAEFVASLEGSYSGVMGLPLFETAALLRQADLSF